VDEGREVRRLKGFAFAKAAVRSHRPLPSWTEADSAGSDPISDQQSEVPPTPRGPG
jgi:hypothetical protein